MTSSAPIQTQAEIDAEQERMMEEECILVDENDKQIGHVSKRICHKMTNIAGGMLHRAFSVFLFNNEGKLLLQQRAGCKITFPYHWTNTCCSHPLYNSASSSSFNYAGSEMEELDALGVKRAAVRKLEHELGIQGNDVHLNNLHWLTKIHYGAASDDIWGEHEIDWILFTQTDLPQTTHHQSTTIPFNDHECADIKYVSPDELKQMIQQWKARQLLLTPWFALIAEQLLFGWWDKLNEIIQQGGIGQQQREIIHRLQKEQGITAQNQQSKQLKGIVEHKE